MPPQHIEHRRLEILAKKSLRRVTVHSHRNTHTHTDSKMWRIPSPNIDVIIFQLNCFFLTWSMFFAYSIFLSIFGRNWSLNGNLISNSLKVFFFGKKVRHFASAHRGDNEEREDETTKTTTTTQPINCGSLVRFNYHKRQIENGENEWEKESENEKN